MGVPAGNLGLGWIADRKFYDRALFIVLMTSTGTPVPPRSGPGYLTFVEFGSLKAAAAEKKHMESGSTIAWRGVGIVSFENIKSKRGFSGDSTDAVDSYMWIWWKAVLNGDDVTPGLLKRDFNVMPRDRQNNMRKFYYSVQGAVPVNYEPFKGDANSSDVIEEDMELGYERFDVIDATTNLPF